MPQEVFAEIIYSEVVGLFGFTKNIGLGSLGDSNANHGRIHLPISLNELRQDGVLEIIELDCLLGIGAGTSLGVLGLFRPLSIVSHDWVTDVIRSIIVVGLLYTVDPAVFVVEVLLVLLRAPFASANSTPDRRQFHPSLTSGDYTDTGLVLELGGGLALHTAEVEVLLRIGEVALLLIGIFVGNIDIIGLQPFLRGKLGRELGLLSRVKERPFHRRGRRGDDGGLRMRREGNWVVRTFLGLLLLLLIHRHYKYFLGRKN